MYFGGPIRKKETALSLGHWPWILAVYYWLTVATDT